jgi:predicted transcriptional regulator
MSTKTTVYLDAAAYRRLRQLARRQRRPAAELVREAVAEYVRSRAPARRPRSLGVARGGRANLGQRDEELLHGFGRR